MFEGSCTRCYFEAFQLPLRISSDPPKTRGLDLFFSQGFFGSPVTTSDLRSHGSQGWFFLLVFTHHPLSWNQNGDSVSVSSNFQEKKVPNTLWNPKLVLDVEANSSQHQANESSTSLNQKTSKQVDSYKPYKSKTIQKNIPLKTGWPEIRWKWGKILCKAPFPQSLRTSGKPENGSWNESMVGLSTQNFRICSRWAPTSFNYNSIHRGERTPNTKL